MFSGSLILFYILVTEACMGGKWCYVGTDDNYKIVRCVTDGCSRIQQHGGHPWIRTCGSKEVHQLLGTNDRQPCKTNHRTGATLCTCTGYLCNTGSNTKTVKTFHVLMVTLVMSAIPCCIKTMFI